MPLSRRQFSIALGLLPLARPAVATDPVSLRVSSFTPEVATGVKKVIKPYLQAVEAELGSRIRFRTFWGGALGRDPFMQYELVRRNVPDMVWVLPGYTPGQFPQIHVTELPFLVRNATESSLAGWRLIDDGLVSGFGQVKALTFWSADASVLHARKPVTSFADIAGWRVRTAGAVQARMIRRLSAAPQTLGSVEVNDALDRGAISGVVQGWTGMRTFRTFESTLGAYNVPLGATPFLLAINQRRWDSLPGDIQRAMMHHGGARLARQAGQAFDQMTAEIIAAQQAQGYQIIEPPADQLAREREILMPLHLDWQLRTAGGGAAYERFNAHLAAIRSERA